MFSLYSLALLRAHRVCLPLTGFNSYTVGIHTVYPMLSKHSMISIGLCSRRKGKNSRKGSGIWQGDVRSPKW